MTMEVKFKLTDYIGSPYWAELSKLINISKGVHPKLGPEKKLAAIKANCAKIGVSPEEYASLQEKVKEKWYKNDEGYIIIPRHQMAGMLVQTVVSAPKAIRGSFKRDSFRSLVRLGDFVTNKKEKDGLFERYVKGESNERRFQSDEVVEDITCVGEITLHPSIEEEEFLLLLHYGVQTTGLGSSRVMGYGRGEVLSPRLKNPIDFRALNKKKVSKEE
jgi:hypothetical protein